MLSLEQLASGQNIMIKSIELRYWFQGWDSDTLADGFQKQKLLRI
jgi:hypothetical protein